MCITSGEYAHEKIIRDNVLIGDAPTTTDNNYGQPTKRKKQITRERWRAFRIRMYIL